MGNAVVVESAFVVEPVAVVEFVTPAKVGKAIVEESDERAVVIGAKDSTVGYEEGMEEIEEDVAVSTDDAVSEETDEAAVPLTSSLTAATDDVVKPDELAAPEDNATSVDVVASDEIVTSGSLSMPKVTSAETEYCIVVGSDV